MRTHSSFFLVLVLVLCTIYYSLACTTLVVGRSASIDGSVLLTHSNDFELNPDARLCWIPAKDHTSGSTRPIFGLTEYEVYYKRHVGFDRGECYVPEAGEEVYKPIGFIPQVGHTFSYYEAQYGLVNEHGLGMGESTCASVFRANATNHGGKALLSVEELTRIALERSRTAREAVTLMGSLAELYGFYGSDTFEGSGESLMVGDPQEAFIFHILPDPTGASAIWAAQRVPDDHVGVVPNMFVIRGIHFDQPQNFLFSQTVKTVAIEMGWWTPSDGLLDFTKVYSDGEYDHKFYSGRRSWGAYRLFGIDFPDDYSDLRYETVYPATAKPPRKVAVKDLFGIHRDFYQGTKYDMTKGIAAGPWGDPDRWKGYTSVRGNWERSIGVYRTSTTHVAQIKANGQGSILWFAPHASASSVFIPVVAKGSAVPRPYTVAPPSNMDPASAYSVHKLVANVAKIKYNYAMLDIGGAQSRLEKEGFELIRRLDAAGEVSAAVLDRECSSHAGHVMEVFSALPMELLLKFADGNLDGVKQQLGYPAWWLKAVGFQHGPPPPPTERCGPKESCGPWSDVYPRGVGWMLGVSCCLLTLCGMSVLMGRKCLQKCDRESGGLQSKYELLLGSGAGSWGSLDTPDPSSGARGSSDSSAFSPGVETRSSPSMSVRSVGAESSDRFDTTVSSLGTGVGRVLAV